MINKKYIEFQPSLQASEDLMQQVNAVSKEMEALKNCIETEVRVTLFRNKMLELLWCERFIFLFVDSGAAEY